MNKKIDFLGIPIAVVTMQETLDKIEKCIEANQQIHHSVVNAGKVVLMQKNADLKKSVLDADLINADGQAIVWAASFLGMYLPERVAGIDLMENLVALSFKKGYKCFFFGAQDRVVNKLIHKYSKLYSKEIIAGFRGGFYNSVDEKDIVNEIASSGANILFVAMSSPKKEIFLNIFKYQLRNINFIMGVGGSFDVVSGEIKRAPIFMQKNGFEWLYRLIKEPSRMWRRYLIGNLKFIIIIIKSFIR